MNSLDEVFRSLLFKTVHVVSGFDQVVVIAVPSVWLVVALLAGFRVIRVSLWCWLLFFVATVVSFSGTLYWRYPGLLSWAGASVTWAPWIGLVWRWVGIVIPAMWIVVWWIGLRNSSISIRSQKTKRATLIALLTVMTILSAGEMLRFYELRDWWLPRRVVASKSPDKRLVAVAYRTHGFDVYDELVIQFNALIPLTARRVWGFPERSQEPTEILWTRDSKLVTVWDSEGICVAYSLELSRAIRIPNDVRGVPMRESLRHGIDSGELLVDSERLR